MSTSVHCDLCIAIHWAAMQPRYPGPRLGGRQLHMTGPQVMCCRETTDGRALTYPHMIELDEAIVDPVVAELRADVTHCDAWQGQMRFQVTDLHDE